MEGAEITVCRHMSIIEMLKARRRGREVGTHVDLGVLGRRVGNKCVINLTCRQKRVPNRLSKMRGVNRPVCSRRLSIPERALKQRDTHLRA